MDWKSFFSEFSEFAPQHTSIVLPATLGLFCFCIIYFIGDKYNKKELDKRYLKNSVAREPEQVARLIILLVFAFFAGSSVMDMSYTIFDWSKNKKWYVWKYKWFPYMLS
tara:strand:- start:121 stop:447 length:327 start_codon:yes stop_codon:yes gene_type:complete